MSVDSFYNAMSPPGFASAWRMPLEAASLAPDSVDSRSLCKTEYSSTETRSINNDDQIQWRELMLQENRLRKREWVQKGWNLHTGWMTQVSKCL